LRSQNNGTKIMEHEVKLYRPLAHAFYTSDNENPSISLLPCSFMLSFLVRDVVLKQLV
jgi:hypothetical protein